LSDGLDTSAGSSPAASPPAASSPGSRAVLIAVQGEERDARESAGALEERLRAGLSGEPVVLLAARRGGEVVLVPREDPGDGTASRPAVPISGVLPAFSSALGPLLREGLARDAAAMALVSADPRDEAADWLRELLAPVLDAGFDLVCPAYRRHRTDGAINSGIVAPLLRSLYGQALRQPLGTEVALSSDLARRLVADRDWERRPAEAGSDAWLLAKALGSDTRLAQAWLGAWPVPRRQPEEASQALIRALGPLFTEMERDASRWQRGGPARSVAIFGVECFEPGGERLDADHLTEALAIGLRDLRPVLDLVLPPASLLALQRAAARTGSDADLGDDLWARVVFDFAVAHMTRVVERRQLLASLTPVYLGWLGGLVRASARLDDAGFAARLDAVGAAFAAEKRYLVARWRWPDHFNP